MQSDRRDVLRFAVAMRGGVSLAVWIGGALGEIDRVRRQGPGDVFVDRLLAATRFGRLEVDILAGASAGGLNAALGGLAIATGAPMNLRDVWMQTASLDELLTPTTGPHRRRSLLNGGYFLDELTRRLQALADPDPEPDPGPEAREAEPPRQGRPVEVFLAATVLGGVAVSDAADPAFSDRRREAYFHFRHFAACAAFSDLTDRPTALADLATAARSSASFPFAFAPQRLTDAQVQGIARFPGSELPDRFHLYDGGIVDNIPVSRAVRAAALSPSQDAVSRWVVFLHPSPSLPATPAATATGGEPTLIGVLRDVASKANTETLLDDLDALEVHNQQALALQLQRLALCQHVLAGDGATHGTNDGAAAVGDLRALDAECLYAMLDDPAARLTWIAVREDPPPSPLASLTEAQRQQLRQTLLAALPADEDTIRPFARLVRLAHLVIEWIRWVEEQSPVGTDALRREAYDVLQIAQLVDAALDRIAINATPGGPIAALGSTLASARWSAPLLDLAAAVGAPGEADEGGWLHLRDRLTGGSRDTLDSLALGDLPLLPSTAPTDATPSATAAAAGPPPTVDAVLLHRLATVACTLLSLDLTFGDREPNLFRSLHERARPGPVAASDVQACLLDLDHATAGLHRGRAVGMPRVMRYLRISGAAPSPLASGPQQPFPAPWPTSGDLVCVDGGIDPRAKLSGNRLANFAAFVSQRFRANDWMWGRMDAAAGLVDILLRPDHLRRFPDGTPSPVDRLVAAVGEAVTCPFAAGTADTDAAVALMDGLWQEWQPVVEAELLDALEGSDAAPLARTRQLLTARWQLEIFLAEIGPLLEAPLHPGVAAAPLAALPDDTPAPDRIQKRLDDYDRCPRQLGAIWGQRETTALGVRVARATARAVAPGPGVVAWLGRTLIAAPLMVVAAALLARGAFLIASSLLTNVVLLPRLHGLAAIVVLGLSTGASLALWSRFVRRPELFEGWDGWAGTLAGLAAVALHGFGLVALLSDTLLFRPPESFVAAWPWDMPDGQVGELWWSAVVVGVAVAVASALIWVWARLRWIVVVALVSGLLMGTWVVVGAWDPPDDPSLAQQLLELLDSLWFPAAVLVLSFTSVALRLAPEDRP